MKHSQPFLCIKLSLFFTYIALTLLHQQDLLFATQLLIGGIPQGFDQGPVFTALFLGDLIQLKPSVITYIQDIHRFICSAQNAPLNSVSLFNSSFVSPFPCHKSISHLPWLKQREFKINPLPISYHDPFYYTYHQPGCFRWQSAFTLPLPHIHPTTKSYNFQTLSVVFSPLCISTAITQVWFHYLMLGLYFPFLTFSLYWA